MEELAVSTLLWAFPLGDLRKKRSEIRALGPNSPRPIADLVSKGLVFQGT
jgi:hypothetical protein